MPDEREPPKLNTPEKEQQLDKEEAKFRKMKFGLDLLRQIFAGRMIERVDHPLVAKNLTDMEG